MVVYGLRHLARIRESNARIHQLLAEIDTYERNKAYMRELEEEYLVLQKQLSQARQAWSATYLPAVERRRELLRELDFAKSHTTVYFTRMAESLRNTSDEALSQQIRSLEGPRLKDITLASPPLASADEGLGPRSSGARIGSVGASIRASLKSSKVAKAGIDGDRTAVVRSLDLNCELPSGVPSVTDSAHTGETSCRSWSLPSLTKRLLDLERIHSQLRSEMGPIGAQTGALTVKVRKAETELASLRASMSMQPEHLYEEPEAELARYRLEGLRRCSQVRASPPRFGSMATASTVSNTPSLVYSVGTALTSSSIGLDFLKSAETSLCEIEAKYL